jgi:hypothetical protein
MSESSSRAKFLPGARKRAIALAGECDRSRQLQPASVVGTICRGGTVTNEQIEGDRHVEL